MTNMTLNECNVADVVKLKDDDRLYLKLNKDNLLFHLVTEEPTEMIDDMIIRPLESREKFDIKWEVNYLHSSVLDKYLKIIEDFINKYHDGKNIIWVRRSLTVENNNTKDVNCEALIKDGHWRYINLSNLDIFKYRNANVYLYFTVQPPTGDVLVERISNCELKKGCD